MEQLAHTRLDEILEEFDDDPVALATEVLALRRVIEELQPSWPLRPRMATS